MNLLNQLIWALISTSRWAEHLPPTFVVLDKFDPSWWLQFRLLHMDTSACRQVDISTWSWSQSCRRDLREMRVGVQFSYLKYPSRDLQSSWAICKALTYDKVKEIFTVLDWQLETRWIPWDIPVETKSLFRKLNWVWGSMTLVLTSHLISWIALVNKAWHFLSEIYSFEAMSKLLTGLNWSLLWAMNGYTFLLTVK